VGLTQQEAEAKVGRDNIVIGFQKYENTARGNAMAIKDYFVKVILEQETQKILGCHIIGPQASELIQEVINLMYTPEQTPAPIEQGMHIHPALPEVVQRAFGGYMEPDHYDHLLADEGLQ
jgi:dihydrolipoamide dehydrogenase